MDTTAVTQHVLDQDVFQTARALHARFHDFMQLLGLQCPTSSSPSVSQEMSQHFRMPACWTVSSVVYFRCTCTIAPPTVHCWQQGKFSCRRMPFGLTLRLPRIGYRVPTDTRSVGVSITVYDEAHWFVQTTFRPFCLHSPNRVTHANPAISRVPASAEPVGRTPQNIYLLWYPVQCS
jgi:hypothetical protein